jgi:hypothetical protein
VEVVVDQPSSSAGRSSAAFHTFLNGAEISPVQLTLFVQLHLCLYGLITLSTTRPPVTTAWHRDKWVPVTTAWHRDKWVPVTTAWHLDKWVPVATAWRVLRLRMEERPPDMEVPANILNMQSRTADRGGPPAFGLGEVRKTSHGIITLRDSHRTSAGSCECGNERSGFMKCREFLRLSEDMLASQKGLYSME